MEMTGNITQSVLQMLRSIFNERARQDCDLALKILLIEIVSLAIKYSLRLFTAPSLSSIHPNDIKQTANENFTCSGGFVGFFLFAKQTIKAELN